MGIGSASVVTSAVLLIVIHGKQKRITCTRGGEHCKLPSAIFKTMTNCEVSDLRIDLDIAGEDAKALLANQIENGRTFDVRNITYAGQITQTPSANKTTDSPPSVGGLIAEAQNVPCTTLGPLHPQKTTSPPSTCIRYQVSPICLRLLPAHLSTVWQVAPSHTIPSSTSIISSRSATDLGTTPNGLRVPSLPSIPRTPPSTTSIFMPTGMRTSRLDQTIPMRSLSKSTSNISKIF